MVPVLALIVMLAAMSVARQQPTLHDVLERVARYLVDYETRLSAVVAEERYEQWIETGRPWIDDADGESWRGAGAGSGDAAYFSVGLPDDPLAR